MSQSAQGTGLNGYHYTSPPSGDHSTAAATPQAPLLRPSKSHSTLADSIRALRESANSSNRSPQAPPSSGLGNRRKKPSALKQTNQSSQKLYERDASVYSPLSPSFSPISPQEGPRSPRQRLDALFATSSNTSSPQDGGFSARPAAQSPQQVKSSIRAAPSHGLLRNASAPIVPTLPARGTSPPTTPTNMLPSRIDPRPVMARTTSIDSGASSISSNVSQSTRSTPAHGHKSSSDDTSSPQTDIAGLMAAAGSAEAALQKLWKEKQSADSHNAQLWRLVEKQRSMILGLNRDLERAVKDKDRYRQKMKELSQNSSAAMQRPDSVLDRENSESPAPAEEHLITSKRTPGNKHGANVPAARSQTSPQQQQQSQMNGAKLAPSPTPASDSASIIESNGDHTSIESSPTTAESVQERSETPALDHEQDPIIVPQSAPSKVIAAGHLPAVTPISPPASPPSFQITPTNAPTLALIEATPVADSGDFSPRSRQLARKAAPAPLNLSQPTRSPPAVPIVDNPLISSPIKTVVPNEPSPLDRGRRKTREDDDRMRDRLAAAQEALSFKISKSKSKSKTPKEQPQIIEPEGPSQTVSPVQGLPPSPRLAHTPVHPASLLSPGGSEASISSTAAYRGNMSTPLLSPGLPLSPRPGDRPFNAPAPRALKQSIPSSPAPTYTPPGVPDSASVHGSAPEIETFSSPEFAAPPSYSTAPPSPRTLPALQPKGFPNTSSPVLSVPTFAQSDLQQRAPTLSRTMSDKPRINIEDITTFPARPSTAISEPPQAEVICRGLMSEQYPGLLLPPNALPSIDVKVASSRLRPSRHSILISSQNDEDPVFLLGIYARSDGKQLWRVEKTIMALPSLHQQVKSLCAFDGKLPEKSIFSGHAPARIDQRRMALNSYFDLLLDTPLSEKAALVVCKFFSTNVMAMEGGDGRFLSPSPGAAPVPVRTNSPLRKEGYLTKRGKNFGGWKARYFVLDGPELRYYDSPGGPQIGTIKLLKAQIGKQSSQQSNTSPNGGEDDAERQYRHAFLVLEPKRKDSSSLVRHVLCAESDEERDAWVASLMAYVDYHEERSNASTPTPNSILVPASISAEPIKAAVPHRVQTYQPKDYRESPSHDNPIRDVTRPPTRQMQTPDPVDGLSESVQGMSYEQTIPGERPTLGPMGSSYRSTKTSQKDHSAPSSPPAIDGCFVEGPYGYNQPTKDRSFMISAPSNGVKIQDAGMWGNKTPAKEKKKSIFGFRGRAQSDVLPGQTGSNAAADQPRRHVGRPIFGMPLAEAVEASQPIGVDIFLPAVVYRCIEYLEVREAINEEGIFRLSGSQNVIKALRERFNTEIDVKLLDGDYYDPHAVASLLKLYLRELPASVLTRELHLDFLKVLDVEDKDKRVAAFNILVHKLPRANAELLTNLCSYLADISNRADLNKMNVRNVAIVFAPTLNIPAPLIQLFLTDYVDIFGEAIDEKQSPIREITVTAPLASDSIRSPRHQMFSDLPTPAYNQTGFAQSISGFQPLSQPSQQSTARNTYLPHPQQQQQQSHIDNMPPPAIYNLQPNSNNGSESFQSLDAMSQHSNGSGGSKKNRRESSMMGFNVGLVGQRQPSRQTLRDTSNSQIPEGVPMYTEHRDRGTPPPPATSVSSY